MIPFASSPINELKWWDLFKEELDALGEQIKETGIRVSMHPGQYTVLNSPNPEVVDNAVKELLYHAQLLNSLHTTPASKIILHVGGVYGDKSQAMTRFVEVYKRLPSVITERLIIENDDVSYSIADVLTLSAQTGAPVVYDNLHNALLPADVDKTDADWIIEARKTWKKVDGRQKVHYSQQGMNRKPGGHSDTIHLTKFVPFYESLSVDVDIMLEVKDKNLSALKVLQVLEPERGWSSLKEEWSLYQYAVLERSPALHKEIETLLGKENRPPVIRFYSLIDEARQKEPTPEQTLLVLEKMWAQLKLHVTEKERLKYAGYLTRFKKGTLSDTAIKNLLRQFAQTYSIKQLIESYTF